MIIKAGGGRRYEVFLRGGREKIDTGFAGVPYPSEQAAGEALMETVVAWYGGMQ